jgi:hypothetical protein
MLECATHLDSRVQDLEKSKWLNSKVNDWADESKSLAKKYVCPL